MLWFGTEKARFKLQRRIMGVVLLLAMLFLVVQVEAYLSGCGTAGDVLDGVFISCFAGGMFYLAGRW
ncbi:hypothetical protein [Pseudomonas urmiensis]|uniref:Uncharacterized protein n=1 Tax=Pseudomonas urmiensis TaxID=2745493 RepID=A0A923JVC0_9PSED|nr:hypothetical protein [Pseudomonas urmiensis]MBV4535711.1 hypothetical protein [Pseudomonas urmiensis]